MVWLEDWWNKWHYSETLVISEDVKELVFKHVWQLVKKIQHPIVEDEVQSTPYENGTEEPMAMMPSITEGLEFHPELYDDTARRHKKFDDALNFSGELQEMILTWHLFTKSFLWCSRAIPKYVTSLAHVKAIEALSDYMVFLVVLCPDTIHGIELSSMYEATCNVMEEVWLRMSRYQHRLSAATRKERFAGMLGGGGSTRTSPIISHAILYTYLLQNLIDKPGKPSIISRYEDRDRVAMDKLRHLKPDLESSYGGGMLDMHKAWELILDTWVRLLVLASV